MGRLTVTAFSISINYSITTLLNYQIIDIKLLLIGPQEVDDQSRNLGRLLLLYPVSRAVNQVGPLVLRAHSWKPFDRSRTLVDAPVAFAADEHRGHIDRQAGK